MKLDKLRMIRVELERDLKDDSIEPSVYYHFNGRWNRLDDPRPVSEQVSACLDKAKTETVAYHSAKSTTAWFSCPTMNCSVSLNFATSPRLTTRKSFRNRLNQLLVNASNAYRVAHNPLTLLLSKDAFRAKLEGAIQSIKSEVLEPPDSQGVAQQRQLAVFALDIDHFKQVNDSHGHLYGDQVLQAFGIRLERASEEWKIAGHSDITIDLGHPSGEEFLVLIVGVVTKDKLIELGNFFRKKISNEPLPSESEWLRQREIANLSMLIPPPLHERTITTSVGIAQYSASVNDQEPQADVSQLLDEADTALYRAKAGGRNQVIVFDDILSDCGRVLEQDDSTRIVAIDIGKNVGVTVGQEFRVFLPGFTGKRKFQISDGRSTRTIGTYPRFDLTRITVFDVQPELSFAFISDPSENALRIDPGSHLESIPLGSIGHLLPHASKYLSSAVDGATSPDVTSALAFIADSSQVSQKPYAVNRRAILTRQGV